jgi:pimeloyl-ACP methyl ester carboxylesterase
MILFVHGTGATNSLWMPHIRAIFGSQLDRLNVSDMDLLDAFTITLPGHPNRDASFDAGDVIERIESFHEHKLGQQRELATRLIKSKNPRLIEVLSESKMTIIGHSVGGALTLLYTGKHPQHVSKVIIVSAGNSFFIPTVMAGVVSFKLFIKPRSLKSIRNMLPKISNLRQRVMWTMFAENTERKGFLSCIEIILKYNLRSWFRTLSVDQQKELARVKMVYVNGLFDHLNLVSSTNSAYNLFVENSSKYNSANTSNSPKSKSLEINLEDKVLPDKKDLKPVTKVIINTAGHNVVDHPVFLKSLNSWLFE